MSIYRSPDLYDQQYLRYRDDIPHYLRLAADYGSPILELGAGTGRLSSALAKAGYEVAGVELSSEMLARGRENIAAEGVAGKARLLPGDMRTLRLGERFPLVIAGFNTLMHLYTLDDQDAALSAVVGHLAPGGAFAFDLFMPIFGEQGVLRREAEWGEVGGEQSELLLVQEHDRLSQTISSRYLLDTVGKDGLVRRQTATLRQRYFTRFEIERALRQAGFSEIELLGGFDGRPLGGDSRHIVGVARAQAPRLRSGAE